MGKVAKLPLANALRSLRNTTNAELWNIAREKDPTFASHTSKGTADMFTERGYEMITRNGIRELNEFYGTIIQVAIQMVNASKVVNPLANAGIVEVFDTPWGGHNQRISIEQVKPVSPRYRNLQNGQSVDPWTVRKPKLNERFSVQNFDFQSIISNQGYNMKTIVASEYGYGEIMAGLMSALTGGYTKQESVNIRELFNTALNSTNHPLQSSQKVDLTSWSASPTAAELTELIKIVKNVVRYIEASPSTSRFNTAKFDTHADVDDLIFVVRPSVLTDIEVLNQLNAPGSGFPIKVVPILNFGGMVPYDIPETGDPVRQQPVYDDVFGEEVGYVNAAATVNGGARVVNGRLMVNITLEGVTQDVEALTSDDIQWVDPNANVIGVIVEKGVFFEESQNAFTIDPTPLNPAGLYVNYWANRPGTAINYDHYKTFVPIYTPGT